MAPETASSRRGGELLANVDLDLEDYQFDDPPIELAVDGGFDYVLSYHCLASG